MTEMGSGNNGISGFNMICWIQQRLHRAGAIQSAGWVESQHQSQRPVSTSTDLQHSLTDVLGPQQVVVGVTWDAQVHKSVMLALRRGMASLGLQIPH
jgi:hypothetical protein